MKTKSKDPQPIQLQSRASWVLLYIQLILIFAGMVVFLTGDPLGIHSIGNFVKLLKDSVVVDFLKSTIGSW